MPALDKNQAIAVELLRRTKPWLYFRYHPKQLRALKLLADNDTLIVDGSNRSGKTAFAKMACVMAIAGEYPIENAFRIPTRDDPFKVRIISKPRMIRLWQHDLYPMFPDGVVKKGPRNSNGYNDYWDIEGDGFWGYIDFVSVNSDPTESVGVELDLLIGDEPMSYAMRSENVSRMSASQYTLKELHVLTPLEGAAWMDDEFFGSGFNDSDDDDDYLIFDDDKPELSIGHIRFEIYDNSECNGGFMPDRKVRLFVERMKRNPLLFDARVLGKRTGAHRRIIPNFDYSVHTFDPARMKNWKNGRPPEGSLYITVDPHGARPDFVQFWVPTAEGKHYLVYEFPNFVFGEHKGRVYEKMSNRPLDYVDLARNIIGIAKWLGLAVEGCAIDPHFTDTSTKRTGISVVEHINNAIDLIDDEFPHFRRVSPLRDGSKEIIAGHKAICELLSFDPDKAISRNNTPLMFFSTWCKNTIRAVLNYREEPPSEKDGSKPFSGKPEELYKHAIDTIRIYLSMKPVCIRGSLKRNVLEPPTAAVA